jgi:uncharacterized protein
MAWPTSKRIASLCLLFAAIIFAAPPRHATAIPSDDLRKSLRPTGHVNDFAHVLTPAEKESLEARCKQLQDRTGAQLAVVTLKSLQGGQINDFAVKLFKQWGIGEKDKKNGVLLIVAIDDHQGWIEIGYGLEPIIPDMLAGRIYDGQLRPQFRDRHYAAGLRDTVNALSELIEKGEPADRNALARPSDWFTSVLFLCLFVGFGGFAIGLGLGIPQIALAMFGSCFGGFAGLIGYGIAGATSLVFHLPVGALAALAGYALSKQGGNHPRGGHRYSLPGSGWNWSSFPTTSGGGWSSGGWSSGGGGFSQDWGGFGGGSSGGAGAGGSW